MIPINVYALTRIQDQNLLQKMERQMSKREHFLTIKDWEIDGLRTLCKNLSQTLTESVEYNFYYSFQIPKLGKEFDLLRISEDMIVNIELKSGNVSDDVIKKQLVQNKYYLASLGRNVRSYTYISEENRLLRLTNSENLIESDWESLAFDLQKQTDCYEADAEALFKEENYLISPLTDPEKFLNREYFLTFQQKDIRNHILHHIDNTTWSAQGFTGLPGTGKTLLLYDIAMRLSERQRVCVLHFGPFPQELIQLNQRLKRIDFYDCGKEPIPDLSDYAVIFIDEGHQISKSSALFLLEYGEQNQKPLIFSYDQEEAVSDHEKETTLPGIFHNSPHFIEYRLTNRIRMNSELSNFIHCMMHPTRYHRRAVYPSVSVMYAGNTNERQILLTHFEKLGYIYLHDASTCKEYDKVVMVINEEFYYDKEGFLRSFKKDGSQKDIRNSEVLNLFHGLNRAKNEIALVVVKNLPLLESLLSILQN